MNGRWWRFPAMAVVLLLAPVVGVSADGGGGVLPQSKGQLVYVSAYSHVYMLDKKRKLYLSVTLSLRNTDLNDPLTVRSVRYYDSDGKLLREFVDQPATVPALGTVDMVIDRSDRSGGSGANFLVEWSSEKPIAPPIVESLMVSAGAGSSALAFARSGRVLEER